MKAYRLLVYREGSHLGTFEPNGLVGTQGLCDLLALFTENKGLSVEVQSLLGERRVLESTPDGIRLLAAERIFVTEADHAP